MELLDLIKEINYNLKEGISLTKQEQVRGYGKDTLRKKLNRAGFRYDRKLNKYIKLSEKESDIDSEQRVSYGNTKNMEVLSMEKIELIDFKSLSQKEKIELVNELGAGKKTLTQIAEQHCNFTNIGTYIDNKIYVWSNKERKYNLKEDVELENIKLTQEQKELLLNMLERESVVQEAITPTDEKPERRSSFVYKSQFDEFAELCKKHQIAQADALYIAIDMFMKSFK